MNGVQDSVRVLVLYKHEPVWLLLIQYRAKGWTAKVLCGTNCGSVAARKWKENEKIKRKWREYERMEKE